MQILLFIRLALSESLYVSLIYVRNVNAIAWIAESDGKILQISGFYDIMLVVYSGRWVPVFLWSVLLHLQVDWSKPTGF
jgi:hypothetical protein